MPGANRSTSCWSIHRPRSLIHRTDLAILQAAERVGNVSWVLRELADGAWRRFFALSRPLPRYIFS